MLLQLDKVAQLVSCWTSNRLLLSVGRWFNSRPGHLGLSLGKTVYSILPQSTQLQNRYLALKRQCLEHARYMLPAALEYPLGDWNGFRVYRPAREGRSWEHFGGYTTVNRIPFTFILVYLVLPSSFHLIVSFSLSGLPWWRVAGHCHRMSDQSFHNSSSVYKTSTKLLANSSRSSSKQKHYKNKW